MSYESAYIASREQLRQRMLAHLTGMHDRLTAADRLGDGKAGDSLAVVTAELARWQRIPPWPRLGMAEDQIDLDDACRYVEALVACLVGVPLDELASRTKAIATLPLQYIERERLPVALKAIESSVARRCASRGI